MSSIDLSLDDIKKMKVVELREALKARHLDTKGVKAVLAKRLSNFISQGSDTAAGGL